MNKLNHVLLVDDDDISNFITERFLLRSEVVTHLKIATNGMEAKDYLSKGSEALPDLILLDLNMPLMDGFEFLKYYETADFSSRSRIVVLTSSTRKEEKDMCMKFKDVIGFMEKPLSGEKIETLVRDMD